MSGAREKIPLGPEKCCILLGERHSGGLGLRTERPGEFSQALWSSALAGWLGVSGAREKIPLGPEKCCILLGERHSGGLGLRTERPGEFSQALWSSALAGWLGVSGAREKIPLGPASRGKKSACCWGERHSGGSGLRPREIQGRVLRLSGLLLSRGG